MLVNTQKYKLLLTGSKRNMFKMNHKLLSILSVCLLGISSSAYAASNQEDENTAYVDSVYGWGAWELGLLHLDSDPKHAIRLMLVCVDYERSVGDPQAEASAAYIAEIKTRTKCGVKG